MSLTSWRNLMVPPRLSRSFSDPVAPSDSSRRQVALIWMRVRRVCGAIDEAFTPAVTRIPALHQHWWRKDVVMV